MVVNRAGAGNAAKVCEFLYSRKGLYIPPENGGFHRATATGLVVNNRNKGSARWNSQSSCEAWQFHGPA